MGRLWVERIANERCDQVTMDCCAGIDVIDDTNRGGESKQGPIGCSAESGGGFRSIGRGEATERERWGSNNTTRADYKAKRGHVRPSCPTRRVPEFPRTTTLSTTVSR
jgi:hypothetical protein